MARSLLGTSSAEVLLIIGVEKEVGVLNDDSLAAGTGKVTFSAWASICR